MSFTGFPVEAIEFFDELTADNTKTFWVANKDTYDALVKAPMEALLADLAPEFGEGHLFRPHRDVRFSKDKSPYKTNIAARLGGGGYVSLSSDGLGTGLGYYGMAKDQLVSFRAAIDDDATGAELVAVIDAVEASGLQVTARESLKTAPRGMPKDHPRIELLRMKGCHAWRTWEPDAWFDSTEPVQRITDALRAARPLVDWLDTHVGPSELEGAWG